jgi:hypothetical protein
LNCLQIRSFATKRRERHDRGALIDRTVTQYQDSWTAGESFANEHHAQEDRKPMAATSGRSRASGAGYLDGQLLIAMPVMDDERASRAR